MPAIPAEQAALPRANTRIWNAACTMHGLHGASALNLPLLILMVPFFPAPGRLASGPTLRRYFGIENDHFTGAAFCPGSPERRLTVALLDWEGKIAGMGVANQPCRRTEFNQNCGFRIPVPCRDIADVRGNGVDLLKLDIEGAEIECLERLLESGAIRSVRHLVAEVHLGRDNALRTYRVLAGLAEAGFDTAFDASIRDWLGPETTTSPFPGVGSDHTFMLLRAWQTTTS